MLTGANRNLSHLPPEYVVKLRKRFWEKVLKRPGECWTFMGAQDGWGYGKLFVSELGRAVFPKAHVVSWLLTHGSIPGTLDVCHSCNNKLCVNPDHLYAATRSINVQHACRDGLQYTRLNDIEVASIRKLWEEGNHTQYQLADLFAVDQQIISRIIRREAFRWVD